MTMIDFSHRSTQSEWMDDPSVSFDDFRSCLVDLARVNGWMLAHRATLRFLDGLFPPGHTINRPIEIVDVGSGYGDLLRQIAAWARRRDIEVSLTGVDLNPWSRAAAMEATDPGLGIRWVTADALAHTPARGIDVVVSSQFTHHLPNERIIEFIQWMEEHARLGWFINDLHRHPVAHHMFGWFADLAALHPFVRHDGPVSIARGFVAEDWQRLLAGAGVEPQAAEIEWTFPFRLTVARRKEVSTWSTQS
jgi:SAM-dependent methyltransferase